MKVLKFGGTSVATSESLKLVVEIIKKSTKQKQLVVVSALGGITNLLVEMATAASRGEKNFKAHIKTVEDRHLAIILDFIPVTKQSGSISFLKSKINELESVLESLFTLKELTSKSLAKISSYGEILSSTIIYDLFKYQGIDVTLKDSRDLLFTQIVNDREIIDHKKSSDKTQKFVKQETAAVIIVPGFIASDENGDITTLGRGGSDFSAALFASFIDASVLEIWTDVSGMFTAHPKLVSQALPIPKLSYHEAMELSHFGAKVIYPPTLQPIIEKEIPMLIKNTFDQDAAGTVIDSKGTIEGGNGTVVKGVSHIENVALVSLEGSGMIGIPGFSKRLFECLSNKKINK